MKQPSIKIQKIKWYPILEISPLSAAVSNWILEENCNLIIPATTEIRLY
jgi:hypothetical protein